MCHRLRLLKTINFREGPYIRFATEVAPGEPQHNNHVQTLPDPSPSIQIHLHHHSHRLLLELIDLITIGSIVRLSCMVVESFYTMFMIVDLIMSE